MSTARTLWGVGLSTIASDGTVLDAWYPELGLGALLKPTRWVGLSAGIGYRVSLTDMDYKADFDGWYYSYRLMLFVGPVWHDAHELLRRRKSRRNALRIKLMPPPL